MRSILQQWPGFHVEIQIKKNKTKQQYENPYDNRTSW